MLLTVVSAMAAAKVEAADEDSTGFHHWPFLAMEQSLDVACYAHYQPSRVDAEPLFEAIANRNLANARSVIDLTTLRAWYDTLYDYMYSLYTRRDSSL
jgi:hypothetical protein